MTPSGPEQAVLLACRVALGTADRSALLAALPRAAPDETLRLLRRERLSPLAHTVLSGPPPGAAPHPLMAALAADYYAAARRYVIFAHRLGQVLAAFRMAGLPLLVLKGMALAEPLYGNAALRPMDDMDTLVRREDIGRARGVLEGLGYEAPPSFEHEVRHRAASMFAREPEVGPSVRIDLHWDLVDAKSGPMAGRWAEGVWARAAGGVLGEIPMRVLAPTDALLHACVHLTVNHGLLGLLWRLDIGMITQAWRDRIDWEHLVERSVDARLTGIVYMALRCAEATLGVAIPSGVLARLHPRAPRARGLERWLLPRFAALRSIPYQDYLVPLLTMDRARDVAALLLRRIW